MTEGTAGNGGVPPSVDEIVIWQARARRQAARADALQAKLSSIAELASAVDSLEFEREHEDRLMCEDCGALGWPEDGFAHEVGEVEVSFCAACDPEGGQR